MLRRFVWFARYSGAWKALAGLIALAIVLPLHSSLVLASGITWYVTSTSDDGLDGDLVSHSGSLRFLLSNAQSGDFVSFSHLDAAVDTIFTSSTLVVPAGVAVGHTRAQACGNPAAPLVNIQTSSLANPVFSLAAGSTLRGLAIGGGYATIGITGPDVDVCGNALGMIYDGGIATSLPPLGMGLLIGGAHAAVHGNYINGEMVVSAAASDTRIGPALAGSGDGNLGFCGNEGRCAITVLAEAATAAQRVTLRDPFPCALFGLVGSGVSGGDDNPGHTNNWAQTPSIYSAVARHGFTSLDVTGNANPLSLVDIFLDDHISMSRQAAVVADAAGSFSYTGAITRSLNMSEVWVFAASTLADPGHAGRMGSSSQLSAPMQVVSQTAAALVVSPPALTFTATAGGALPASQTLTVTVEPADSSLTWQTALTTSNGSWLSVSPGGSGAGMVTATVTRTDLLPGTYGGRILISSPTGIASSAAADVWLLLGPGDPVLAATGNLSNVTGGQSATARQGDVVRFTIAMTNAGFGDAAGISSNMLSLPAGFDVVAGSGQMAGGGSGFQAGDGGFSSGLLTPGESAVYHLDMLVTTAASLGAKTATAEVDGQAIISVPIVGRITVVAPVYRWWLALIVAGE